MPKDKNVLAIMLGGKGKKKPPRDTEEDYDDEYEEEEGEYGEAFSESAAEAFEALRSRDKESFISSLKDAIVTCVEEQGIE